MKKWNLEVLIIIALGIIIRLLLLPYSQTVHADAISRVINAEVWLANPKYIIADIWGPMNQYLFGFSIKFLGGKIYGPKAINIILASFTAFPLYWFTFNIFKTRKGAIVVALIYVLTPIVIRNSFQALPAVPYAFFVALSMFFLSEFVLKKTIWPLILSAISINFAGALRYEAWVISFFFSLILLFHKQYRAFFTFGLIASLFPLSWLIGNKIVFDNWFYCFDYSSQGTLNELLGGEQISLNEKIKRLIFFPYSLIIVFSPLLFLLIVVSIPKYFINKTLKKEQLFWIIPSLFLLIIYIIKAYQGTLLLQNKYSTIFLVLVLPFVAILFHLEKTKKQLIVYLTIFLIIPSSFLFDQIPWYKILGKGGSLSTIVDELFLNTYAETKPVPRLRDTHFSPLVDKSNQSLKENDGLLVDFIGWQNTYYFSLHSLKTPFIVEGWGDIKFNQINDYLKTHTSGLFLLNYFGALTPFISGSGDTIIIQNTSTPLILSLIQKQDANLLFRYEVVPLNNLSNLQKQETKHILSIKKDVEYYKMMIRRDHRWVEQIRRQAKDEHKSLNEMIRLNADYMLNNTN